MNENDYIVYLVEDCKYKIKYLTDNIKQLQ